MCADSASSCVAWSLPLILDEIQVRQQSFELRVQYLDRLRELRARDEFLGQVVLLEPDGYRTPFFFKRSAS